VEKKIFKFVWIVIIFIALVQLSVFIPQIKWGMLLNRNLKGYMLGFSECLYKESMMKIICADKKRMVVQIWINGEYYQNLFYEDTMFKVKNKDIIEAKTEDGSTIKIKIEYKDERIKSIENNAVFFINKKLEKLFEVSFSNKQY
jgi:hypothetical protein